MGTLPAIEEDDEVLAILRGIERPQEDATIEEASDNTSAEVAEGDGDGADANANTDTAEDSGDEGHPAETQGADDAQSETNGADTTATTGDQPSGDATSEPARTWSLQVNGKEKTVNETELVRLASISAGASDKFEQAKQLHAESVEARRFAEDFSASFKANPAELFAEYIELVPDPNQVIVALINRTLATGKLHPRLAERLGIEQEQAVQAQAKYVTEQRQRQEAERARAAEAQADPRDAFGVPQSQIVQVIPTLLESAGIDLNDETAARAYLGRLQQYRVEHNIADPTIAALRLQREDASAQLVAAEKARLAATVAASPTRRVPGAGVPAGQASAPKNPVGEAETDSRKAALAALREVGLVK